MSTTLIEIPKVVDVALIVPIMKKSKVIDTKGKLRKLANLMINLREFAFDTETNGLKAYGPNKDFMCVGISISWGEYNNYYIPLHHRRHEDVHRNISETYLRKALKSIFENEYVRIIGHNLRLV